VEIHDTLSDFERYGVAEVTAGAHRLKFDSVNLENRHFRKPSP
jgi:hypothetical protein